MRKYIPNKKFIFITIAFFVFFALFYFFFKSTEAQVCLPLTGYLVWPGTWEPGRIPMASNQQYVLTGSPIYVSGSNVGIGTTNPVYTFQVNGDISGTRLCIGSDCRSVWPGGGIAGSGLAGQVTFWTSSTNLGGDNNLFWDNLNKRLGIGTTTPQTSLHVIGNITANNIIASSFLGTINASNISSGQFGANTGGGNYSFMGNVGIGTTAPGQKLDVVGGYIRSDTGFCIGTSCITSWPTGGGYWAASGINIYNTNTGNVGIGTTTPAEKLHVIGNAIISGTLTAGTISGTFTGTINAGNVSSGQFGANTGGGNYSFPGNVGIGTTIPGYKLDIVGALRLQPSSAPIGANGVIYYDSTANKFKCYENGAWKDCISAGGIPSGAYIAFPDPNPRTGFTYTGVIENIEGWTTKTPMPTPRLGLAAAVVNNIIYAIGGANTSGELSTNEAYDPSTNTWTTKAPMPTRRYDLAAAVVNNKIYAIGGFYSIVDIETGAEVRFYLSTNEEYDPSTNTWTTKAPMPTARRSLAAAAVNNKIYAIGGYDDIYTFSKNEEYNPSTDTWTTKTPMPTRRYGLAAAVVNNIIYAIGGYNASGPLSTNEAYNPSTDSWTTKTPMPTPRLGLAAAVVNNIIYAIGGANTSGELSTNEAYDPSTNTWTTKAPMPTRRYWLAAAAANNKIYAIGGYTSGIAYLSTNEAYPFVLLTLYWFQKQ